MFFTKTRMKFLSIFAGIFIIAAMMPASSLSFADENNAAMIDGVSYATLQAALDAADSGETVVLQKNILDERTGSETGNVDVRGLVLKGKKAITLNMNGKSIKEDELAAALSVESGSSLTIDGSGEIENTAGGGMALSGEAESVKESNGSIITFTAGQTLFKAAKIKVYKVTVHAGDGGTVTRIPNVEGGAAYKVASDDGYCIKKITVNAIEQTLTNEDSRTVELKNVQSDQEISAEFMAKTYEIKSSIKTSPAKYVGGIITKTAYVKHNEERTFKVSPKRGFTVKAVYVDGKNVGAVTACTFKNVNKSHEIRAEFKKGLFVMLDAGHYAKYNRYVGTYNGSYYYESQMSWKLHKYLKNELEKFQGIKADKTRPVQKNDLPVYERGKKAEGYDLFLSLHSNSGTSESTDYPLVIRQYGASKKQVKLANKLCATIRDTMNCKNAGKVWSRTYKWKDKKYDWYGVLRGSAAVKTNGYILEHSFHTNKAKAKWLYNNDNLKKMAKNEAEVIAAHYGLTTPVSEANTDAVITDDTA